MKKFLLYIKEKLQKLSFKTGVFVLCLCVLCYIVSFAQMLLPVSKGTHGILFIVFFGLAKTFQYGGLTIVGIEGVKRLKSFFKKKKEKNKNTE
ncbi:MAG: hypothetical protein IJ748_07665 [Bacteroidales bacterium]|nr:hypothetical protein [Bacteroidales bacterium]